MSSFRIETERLVLREWREADVAAHNELRHYPCVAATLGSPPSLERSREAVARQQRYFSELGYCLWVLELRDQPGLVGWCGFQPAPAPLVPDVEVGWALQPELWDMGLATEAAHACLDWVWAETPLMRIVAITSLGNSRSRKVMRRLGMARVEGGDFDHPALSAGDPLRRHVLYSIKRPQ